MLNHNPTSMKSLLLPVLLLCMAPAMAPAGLLDQEQADPDGWLWQIAASLDAYGIDVLTNLNHRDWVGARNFPPRLGGFPDLPDSLMPDSQEIENWEREYAAGMIGGLAVLASTATGSDTSGAAENLWERWVVTYSTERIFISFALLEQEQAALIAQAVAAAGYRFRLFTGAEPVSTAARFYATAAQRLALDSRATRRLDSAVTELDYLGRKVRRSTNSLFGGAGRDRRLARQEPAVFLKESLGGEFTESTVREIIVPGGVALGESATLPHPLRAMRFVNAELELIGMDGVVWQLPDIPVTRLKALFDFTLRSERIRSDAMVDIDGRGRVKISAALRNTDVGFQIMHADTLPFTYVGNLNVTKSVIVDTAVEWFPAEADRLHFVSELEVRFLSADNMRLAQTRVALQYEFASGKAAITHRDNWGRDIGKLPKQLDYAGLGHAITEVAEVAGWVALLRSTLDDQVGFLDGRYELMKIDKRGRATPGSY